GPVAYMTVQQEQPPESGSYYPIGDFQDDLQQRLWLQRQRAWPARPEPGVTVGQRRQHGNPGAGRDLPGDLPAVLYVNVHRQVTTMLLSRAQREDRHVRRSLPHPLDLRPG